MCIEIDGWLSKCTSGLMDGWIEGWTDGRMDEWMIKWLNGLNNRLKYLLTVEWMNGYWCMDGWMNRCDGWDGWKVWTDRQIDD